MSVLRSEAVDSVLPYCNLDYDALYLIGTLGKPLLTQSKP
jgi:hypothetical protein